MSTLSKYAIAGVGETPWTRGTEESTLSLATRASLAAISDAGLRPDEVDGILSYSEGDAAGPFDVAASLGTTANHAAEILGGGSTPELVVATAAAAIEMGMCKTVLCYRSMRGYSGVRMGGGSGASTLSHGEWLLPHGCSMPVQLFALAARRRMHEHGTTSEELGAVAVTTRRHANRNPRALMHGKPMTMGEYLSSRWIAEPLRLLDCCLETDGACAVIVTAADRARDTPRGGVTLLGGSTRTAKDATDYLQSPRLADSAALRAAPRAFAMAGVKPADVDVACLYDAFTFVVLQLLEDCGFVDPGDGGAFALAGNLDLDGALPTNTAGGQLSEGYTHGFNNIIEVVRQVRGDHRGSTRQIPGAEVGFCAGWSSPAVCSALVLGAQR